METIQRHYWWPRMYTFVWNYVNGCTTCQQNKVNIHPTTLPLTPIRSTAKRLFVMLTMDFITDLLVSNSKDSMLIVVDHGLTKGVVLISCTKTFGALDTTDALIRNIYQ